MGIGTDILAAGGNIGSTLLQDRLNTANRHDAQDWETLMYANRYTMMVNDLKRAGLNPMLAYMQSPGGAPSSSAQSVQAPDVVGAINSTRANSAMVANTNADTLKKGAETENVKVDTLVKGGMMQQIAAMTASSLASAEQSKAMAEQIKVTIPKIEMEISKMKTEIEKDKSNIQLNDSLIQANQVLNSLRMAETVLRGQEADINEPKAAGYRNASERDKKMLGKTAGSAEIMQNIWRMVNPFTGKGH